MIEVEKRKRYGIFTGIAGLCLNFMLWLFKLIAGLISGSVSIVTDAMNNLSDCASSGVVVFSFVFGGKKADKEHPYGHGRFEYVASFVIGFLVLFVGVQFLIESVKRIISPTQVLMSSLAIVVLSSSIGIKLFMMFFYKRQAKSLMSDALKASALDSMFDVFITSIVLLCFLINKYLPFNIDGYCGGAVALFVIFGGAKMIFSTTSKLLGNGGDLTLTKKLYELVSNEPKVIAAHGLKLHEYGVNVKIGTVHLEFDKRMSFNEVHLIVNSLEERALREFNVELVIHADPVDMEDRDIIKLRYRIETVLSHYCDCTLHDLQADETSQAITLLIKIPSRYENVLTALTDTLKEEIKKNLAKYSVNIDYEIIYPTV